MVLNFTTILSVLFTLWLSRNEENRRILKGYRGYRLTDDFSGYDGMGINEGIIHVLVRMRTGILQSRDRIRFNSRVTGYHCPGNPYSLGTLPELEY